MPNFALNIQSLSKTYKNGVEALNNVDLKVHKGDFFGLLGPNGAGKSTMIGIITSLIAKSNGRIEIFGNNLETSPYLAKSCIGLVPQEVNFNLFEKVVQIVVNQAGYYGIKRAVALDRAEIVLKELNLWEKRNEPSRSLSGGMKRRLMIARALLHKPSLLILDEPTAGVDIELRRSMWGYLKQINEQGTTIILTTHYLEEAEQLCKNIAIIDSGKIIENTSVKDLLSKLDFEVIVLDLETPVESDLNINGYKTKKLDNTTLEVEICSTLGVNDLFQKLDKQNIKVKSFRNKANRLEELFIKMVNDREIIN